MAKSSKRKLFLWRFLIWILMIIAFGRASYLISVSVIKYIFNEGTMIVPNLTGIKLDKAKKILSSYKLTVVQTAVKHHDFYAPGIIISQDPLPGNKIKKGNRINVTVSNGKLTSLIPDVRGKLLIDAESSLRKYGFIPGAEKYLNSDSIPADHVITTQPQANNRVKSGTDVDILVSSGKNKKVLLIPNLIGMKKSEALSKFKDFKFNIHSEQNNSVPDSCIFRQVPAYGKPSESDNVIDIWVNEVVIPIKGKRHYEMISYIIPPGVNSEQNLRILLTDDQGVREVLNRKVSSGEKINYTVSGIGHITLDLYLDGILVKKMEF
jgi:beta-lactam-binding protein with PASTA domain